MFRWEIGVSKGFCNTGLHFFRGIAQSHIVKGRGDRFGLVPGSSLALGMNSLKHFGHGFHLGARDGREYIAVAIQRWYLASGNPPKPYTEDAERKGLGTPATRAATIEKLVHCGFITRKGQQLLPTPNGINLITVLPERIKSPALTAEWENALTRIAKGELSPESFMRDITALTSELVAQNRTPAEEYLSLFRQEREPVGTCPRCGGDVIEGKKNFYCANKDCSFAMWKEDKFFTSKKKTLTKSMAAELLQNGKTHVTGLYSGKTGKNYDAIVTLALYRKGEGRRFI